MTHGEKKQMLSGYRSIERRIERLLDEKKRWGEIATSVSPHYSPAPKGTGGSDKTAASVGRMVDIEREIDVEVDRLADLRASIEDAIGRIADEKLRELLRYRYIDGMTWEEVAENMHYTSRNIRYLHRKALEDLFFS